MSVFLSTKRYVEFPNYIEKSSNPLYYISLNEIRVLRVSYGISRREWDFTWPYGNVFRGQGSLSRHMHTSSHNLLESHDDLIFLWSCLVMGCNRPLSLGRDSLSSIWEWKTYIFCAFVGQLFGLGHIWSHGSVVRGWVLKLTTWF